MLKSRARETIQNDCTLLSAKELKEVNKKVQQCHNVRRSRGSAQQQHLSLAQLQHIDQNHCLLLFCTPVHPLVLASIHSCRHDGHVYSWMYQKCLHTYMYVHVFNKPHAHIYFSNKPSKLTLWTFNFPCFKAKPPMFCSTNISGYTVVWELNV